jgi:hypothetical protein
MSVLADIRSTNPLARKTRRPSKGRTDMASSLAFSRRGISKAHEAYGRLQRRLEGANKKTEHALDRVISTGLVVGTSAVLGGAHGRFGPIKIVGVPVELAAGGAAFLGSLIGFGGSHSKHLGDVANGLLSPYAYMTMRGVGANLKNSADQKAAPDATPRGPLPGMALNDREAAAIRQPVEVQR